VSFELASTVFRDPKAISVFDSEHGESEERWLTLGISATGALLVVHHTYDICQIHLQQLLKSPALGGLAGLKKYLESIARKRRERSFLKVFESHLPK
jgi:hypothetical protein